jgi:hypothetical protein
MQKARKPKRKSQWDHDKDKIAAAESVLRESKSLSRDPDRLLQAIADGKHVKLPRRTDLGVIAGLFESLQRGDLAGCPLQPDEEALRSLVTFCRAETDLLTDHGASHYANALLALSAHASDWVRPLDAWKARSHNARRQFQSLLRHLISRYDIPTFLDAAWLEGLTADGIKYQRWYKHIAGGGNLRTVEDLPVSLTRRQAHLFLQTPDEFDILSAFRRALIIDLGGDERLVRSILASRIAIAFGAEEFWTTVFRFFIAHPELPTQHHGPIIDFLLDQKFIPSVPNPLADQPGQPALESPQPNLSMKGRMPESLRRAVADWHRDLAERRAVETAVGSWGPSGFTPFVREEETEHGMRVYEVTELLTSQELFEEGKAMSHCVASYARSCASGRSSIWSLRVQIESGRVARLATIEVRLSDRKIIQIRRRSNKLPTSRELSLLSRWEYVGGPGLASWFTI